MFKQERKNTAYFMMEFKALAMKADIDKLHTIFLLKKNVWADIIKTILGYSSIAVPETLKEWKVAIISVGQGYESIKGWHNYRTSIKTIYRGQEILMDIGKTKNNYDKEEKPKCFNCNKYRHIAKECQERKEKDSRKCFKCERKCHIAKDCKEK